VDECLRFVAGAGCREIVLWANDRLTVARRICRRAGFTLESGEPHHGFGRDPVGRYWRRVR